MDAELAPKHAQANAFQSQAVRTQSRHWQSLRWTAWMDCRRLQRCALRCKSCACCWPSWCCRQACRTPLRIVNPWPCSRRGGYWCSLRHTRAPRPRHLPAAGLLLSRLYALARMKLAHRGVPRGDHKVRKPPPRAEAEVLGHGGKRCSCMGCRRPHRLSIDPCISALHLPTVCSYCVLPMRCSTECADGHHIFQRSAVLLDAVSSFLVFPGRR